MKRGVFLLAVGCLMAVSGNIIDTPEEAMDFMIKYGYLDQNDMVNDEAPADVMTKSLQDMQIFAGITMTGELDEKTYEMMNQPRCGVKDMTSQAAMARKKRYMLGTRWPQLGLTWSTSGAPTPDLPESEVDRIMAAALKVWSDVSALSFQKVSSGQGLIDISFSSGEHGDSNPFDGPSGVLAHAYFPSSASLGGDAHFDDDEQYTDGTAEGTNLFQVAAHEFGHSLGLEHSQVQDALMFPYYRGYVPNFQLDQDDINGIQAHYGVNSGMPEEMNTPSTPVEACMPQISLATRTADGSTYFANGTHVFRRVMNTIPFGYPKLISDEFAGLPSFLDAALFHPDTRKTYFFKGSQYWRFSSQTMDSNYPRSIAQDFPGLPNDLSSAFIWSGNGRIYFTKGDQYYRVSLFAVTDSRVGFLDARYPRPLSTWADLPQTIDAAIQWENSVTYFFKGPNYYRFDDRAFRVAADSPAYPRNTAVWWLGCNPSDLGLDSASPTPERAASPSPGSAASTFVQSLVAVLFSAICAFYSSL